MRTHIIKNAMLPQQVLAPAILAECKALSGNSLSGNDVGGVRKHVRQPVLRSRLRVVLLQRGQPGAGRVLSELLQRQRPL